MTAELQELGKTLLYRIPPGAPFVATIGAIAGLAVLLRIALGRSSAGRSWLRLTAGVEHVVLTVLLVAMVLLSIVEIAYRNVFDRGFVWADPLLRSAVLWVGFMGAALATAHDHHINIDAFSRLLRGASARTVHALLRVLAAIVCLLLANATYQLLRDEYTAGSTAVLGLPSWTVMFIMPFTLSVMAYRFLLSGWKGRPAEAIKPVDPEAPVMRPVDPEVSA